MSSKRMRRVRQAFLVCLLAVAVAAVLVESVAPTRLTREELGESQEPTPIGTKSHEDKQMVLTGRCLDAVGSSPVSQVRVLFGGRETTTSNLGEFRLAVGGVRAGRLEFESKTHERTYRDIPEPSAPDSVAVGDVLLRPLVSIRGVVSIQTGMAAVGAQVQLLRFNEQIAAAETDEAGRFSIPIGASVVNRLRELGANARIVVAARLKGYAPDLAPVRAIDQPVALTLPTGLDVRGRVVDATSRSALPGVRITCQRRWGSSGQSGWKYAHTDERGEFVIAGGPSDPSKWMLVFERGGYVARALVGFSRGRDVVLWMRRSCSIEGVLERDGKPITVRGTVTVDQLADPFRDRAQHELGIHSSTDLMGRFKLAGLPQEGVLRLSAFAGIATAQLQIETPLRETITVSVAPPYPMKAVRVRVLDSHNRSFPGVFVVWSHWNQEQGLMRTGVFGPTRDDGIATLEVSSAWSMHYTFHVRSGGYFGSSAPVFLPDIESAAPIQLEARPGIVLIGEVRPPGLSLRACVSLWLTTERGEPAKIAESCSLVDGRFVFTSVPPGSLQLLVSGPKCTPHIERVEVPRDAPVYHVDQIRIVPGTVVKGVVTDSRGNAMEGVSVRCVLGPDWKPYSAAVRLRARSDMFGRFAISNLPPGVLTLVATLPRRRSEPVDDQRRRAATRVKAEIGTGPVTIVLK